jgi:FMN phosphatase YigB (HAD superfamily)
MSRPLLITDCDEVLLHMVVPFAEWLDEAHHIHFDLDTGNFLNALRHKQSGELVAGEKIWPLLKGFFETEMHRQYPIDGAVESIHALAQHADVVVLTNLTDDAQEGRKQQLLKVGIDFPVYTNQGGKGEALRAILDDYAPSVAVFVDDLAHQHESVAEHAPEIFRLHMIGEPRIAPKMPKSKHAHERIDDWLAARRWIMDRFEGVPL